MRFVFDDNKSYFYLYFIFTNSIVSAVRNQRILDLLDFERIDILLEGFNKSTGFVTAILDLEGNVLSKSGWRRICTDFHRVHPVTAEKCTISDTLLAGRMNEGEEYHYYPCLNGLVDVAVPLIINGEHIANLFSGQFFNNQPDVDYFRKQAMEYGFDEKEYLDALEKVPVVSEETVKVVMAFLRNMTQLISDLTFQKLQQSDTNEKIRVSEQKYRLLFESNPHPMWVYDLQSLRFLEVNEAVIKKYGYSKAEFLNMELTDIRPVDEVPKLFENMSQEAERYSFSGEWKHKNKKGEIFYVEIISYSIDFEGRKARMVLANDITERKQAAEVLKSRVEELEKFHRLTVGRELTMIELKREVNELLIKSGREQKYMIVDEPER